MGTFNFNEELGHGCTDTTIYNAIRFDRRRIASGCVVWPGRGITNKVRDERLTVWFFHVNFNKIRKLLGYIPYGGPRKKDKTKY
jgi:hypothetical protein